MTSVQIIDPQSVELLTEIFSSSTKFKSLIPTVLQLTTLPGNSNNLGSPLQNNSIKQPPEGLGLSFF